MKPHDDPEVRAWLEKAKGDLRMAHLAMGTESPLWDQACFHSQQAAEKSLKALFVAVDRTVPRTHDLVQLLDSLAEQLPGLENLAESVALLTQFGVTPRYPSFLASETEEDARAALAAAQELMQRVGELISP